MVLAGTVSPDELKVMLVRAEAALPLVSSSSLSVLGQHRVAVLRRAVELSVCGSAMPAPRGGAFARGSVWTEVVVAGGAVGNPIWKACVSIYLGDKGWSPRHESPLGSIRIVSEWARSEAAFLRKGLAMVLWMGRHSGAERRVRTTPSSQVRASNWGVSGVL